MNFLTRFVYSFFMAFLKAKRAVSNIMGIIVVAITVAIGGVIGLAITAMSRKTFDDMSLAAAANTAMTNTVTTIYSAWPLSGLVVLAAFGAAALGVFIAYLGLRG